MYIYALCLGFTVSPELLAYVPLPGRSLSNLISNLRIIIKVSCLNLKQA